MIRDNLPVLNNELMIVLTYSIQPNFALDVDNATVRSGLNEPQICSHIRFTQVDQQLVREIAFGDDIAIRRNKISRNFFMM